MSIVCPPSLSSVWSWSPGSSESCAHSPASSFTSNRACLQAPICEHWPWPWRVNECPPDTAGLEKSAFVILGCEPLVVGELPEAIVLDHAFANTCKIISFPLR